MSEAAHFQTCLSFKHYLKPRMIDFSCIHLSHLVIFHFGTLQFFKYKSNNLSNFNCIVVFLKVYRFKNLLIYDGLNWPPFCNTFLLFLKDSKARALPVPIPSSAKSRLIDLCSGVDFNVRCSDCRKVLTSHQEAQAHFKYVNAFNIVRIMHHQ